jgi:hypothetical protein
MHPLSDPFTSIGRARPRRRRKRVDRMNQSHTVLNHPESRNVRSFLKSTIPNVRLVPYLQDERSSSAQLDYSLCQKGRQTPTSLTNSKTRKTTCRVKALHIITSLYRLHPHLLIPINTDPCYLPLTEFLSA